MGLTEIQRKDKEDAYQRAKKRSWEIFRGKPERRCLSRLVVACEGKEESRMDFRFSFGSGLDGLNGGFTNHIIQNGQREGIVLCVTLSRDAETPRWFSSGTAQEVEGDGHSCR